MASENGTTGLSSLASVRPNFALEGDKMDDPELVAPSAAVRERALVPSPAQVIN